MDIFLIAVALAVVIEGLVYAAFPNAMKKAMLQLLAQPVSTIRIAGLAAACLGVLVIWLVQG